MVIWRFEAIGTPWEIETERELTARQRARVSQEIERFDGEWSRFRDDSAVTSMARIGGTISSPDAGEMLDAYRVLFDATNGAVNPLVGDSLSAIGYDAQYSLVHGEPQAAPDDWAQRLRWSVDCVSASVPAHLDVGALGKGRLVDLVMRSLVDVQGDLVVDAGGDLRVRGAAVRIGLEHPYDPAKAIGVLTLKDAALCASATNRRAWGDGLHHVLDARTGAPVRSWAATWATTADAMHADAVATALFFEGGPALAEMWGVEWIRMATDGAVERSPGCAAELFVSA